MVGSVGINCEPRSAWAGLQALSPLLTPGMGDSAPGAPAQGCLQQLVDEGSTGSEAAAQMLVSVCICVCAAAGALPRRQPAMDGGLKFEGDSLLVTELKWISERT